MKKLRIPENLTTLAYKQIRTHLLTGPMEEGDRLTEEAVAQQLGISKSPIREAFTRLEADGLIRIEPRRGAYLRSFSIQEVIDIYDFREALEAHAVLTAQVTPALLAELEEHVRRNASSHAANDKTSYISGDIQFHTAIAAATGNRMLCQALDKLQDQLSILRRKTYDLSSSQAVAAHRAILAALAGPDRMVAVEAMRSHIRETRYRLVGFMRAGGG
ncbi:MAG: GntR family transcriptional regulator [Bryobacteraceae bacterium]|nr:GntR family transcriptional regulator [Bryobacteraceae bacterium]